MTVWLTKNWETPLEKAYLCLNENMLKEWEYSCTEKKSSKKIEKNQGNTIKLCFKKSTFYHVKQKFGWTIFKLNEY